MLTCAVADALWVDMQVAGVALGRCVTIAVGEGEKFVTLEDGASVGWAADKGPAVL